MNTHEALCLYRDTAAQIKELKALQDEAKDFLLSAIDLEQLDDHLEEKNRYVFPGERLRLTKVIRRTFEPNDAVKEEMDAIKEQAMVEGHGRYRVSASLRLSEIEDG